MLKIVKYFKTNYMTQDHGTWQEQSFNHKKWRANRAPEALWTLCMNSPISGRYGT